MTRPSWHQTWLEVADVIAQRSRCVRSRAGCVIVDVTEKIVATGYNGPPARFTVQSEYFPQARRELHPQETCDAYCPRARTGGSLSYDDCVSSHAEANALMFSDRSRREGGTLYCTRVPCFMCAKMISNSGIKTVVCKLAPEDADRDPERSLTFMRNSGLLAVEL